MNYIDKINKAIDFIEDNLTNELRLVEIANAAGISKWYFQRQFSAMLGETVKDYTSKRRLSLAAIDLVKTDKKIIDIAFDYRFESHEVFTRAFKRLFNVSPSKFRNTKMLGNNIPHKIKITFEYLEHLYAGVSMIPRIIQLQQMEVMGLKENISSVNDADFQNNQQIIPVLWVKFRDITKNIPKDLFLQRVSLIDSDEGQLVYIAGSIIKDTQLMPKEFIKKFIPAGEYAEFIHKGPTTNINHTMNYIYGSWLPKSGKARKDGPDISFYPLNFEPTSLIAEINILIPIR